MPKIVIDLDDDTYRVVKNELVIISGMRSYKTVFNKILDAIANGTPLPKGHGRLIDADVLADGFEDNYEFCEALNNTPTVIKADSEVDR